MKHQTATINPIISCLFILLGLSFLSMPVMAQKVQWKNVSSEYELNTTAIQVYVSTSSTLNDSAFKAYYVIINTNDPEIQSG